MNSLQIQNYLDKCWVCTKNLPDIETELSVWTFESHDSPSVMTLDLGMHSVDMDGTQVLSLYCPFWMLNKTGFTLCYRVSLPYFLIELERNRRTTCSRYKTKSKCFCESLKSKSTLLINKYQRIYINYF